MATLLVVFVCDKPNDKMKVLYLYTLYRRIRDRQTGRGKDFMVGWFLTVKKVKKKSTIPLTFSGSCLYGGVECNAM